MKIDGNNIIGRLKTYQVKKKDKASPTEASQKVSSNMALESVELSNKAKEIIKIQRQLEQTPEVRQEKVAEISQKIEQGTYKIDAEEVARKMIKDRLTDLVR